MANSAIVQATFPGDGGDIPLIDEVSPLVSAATSMGLTLSPALDPGEVFLLTGQIEDDSASFNAVGIEINSDSTATNYYRQQGFLDGTSTTIARFNDNVLFDIATSDSVGFAAMLTLDLNQLMHISHINPRNIGSSVTHFTRSIIKNTTESTITDIDLVSNKANGIAAGSWMKLFKYGG